MRNSPHWQVAFVPLLVMETSPRSSGQSGQMLTALQTLASIASCANKALRTLRLQANSPRKKKPNSGGTPLHANKRTREAMALSFAA
uniref:Putative secreted protein n=1 Tax=Ixodes ricinus TaxID=34613 RepID=A0A6B0TZD7_IXORI